MQQSKFSKEQDRVDRSLDVSGLFCPEPVMQLHRTMREMVAGEVVRVIATDPSTFRDIPKFCQFLNHELLLSDERKADDKDELSEFVYHIKKGTG